MGGVAETQRNETATRLIGYYHHKGLPESVILTIMEAFARQCQPPMERHELARTIQSVLRYPSGAPKAWVGW